MDAIWTNRTSSHNIRYLDILGEGEIQIPYILPEQFLCELFAARAGIKLTITVKRQPDNRKPMEWCLSGDRMFSDKNIIICPTFFLLQPTTSLSARLAKRLTFRVQLAEEGPTHLMISPFPPNPLYRAFITVT